MESEFPSLADLQQDMVEDAELVFDAIRTVGMTLHAMRDIPDWGKRRVAGVIRQMLTDWEGENGK